MAGKKQDDLVEDLQEQQREAAAREVDRYDRDLLQLQIELVKFQRTLIAAGDRVLVIFEGRDAGGKDGMIKRITEHLSPRDTRVVALGKPSDREASEWYFQRYVARLPAATEMVLFNRSWYNRAGVEKVMGFCTPDQHRDFMDTVPSFEQMLVRDGIKLIKYYLDIDRDEQKKRLRARKDDPLKQWKLSPIDDQAIDKWDAYSAARDTMLRETSSPVPWRIVKADDKKSARINVLRDLLSKMDYKGKKEKLLHPDPAVVFAYDELFSGRLAR